MFSRVLASLLFLLSFAHGCSSQRPAERPEKLKSGPPPQTLAVYEAWFGHPRHISVGYSTQDPDTIRKQIRQAKALGITGFVVDWYGFRQPFIDRSYSVMQGIAAEENFHIAMMYDETDDDDGATDETIEDLRLFYKNYLSPGAAGTQAYLTYNGQPVIFIFPKGKHTDWKRVHAELDKWAKPPLLIDEYPPGPDSSAIDGYYAWVNPGPKKWAADGSNWGGDYLDEFYSTMQSKYPDKIAIGAVWASFDDSKASWGLNRHISSRCGQTLADTLKLWHRHSAGYYMPFVLAETWNDYEEGTAMEPGVDMCAAGRQPPNLH